MNDDDKIKQLFGGGGQPTEPQKAATPQTRPHLVIGNLCASKRPVFVPQHFESRHILLVGTTGSGKSQAIFNLLKTIRARGEKALIMDHGGEILQRFYRPDVDHIFNPFDRRGVAWGPFSEAIRRYDWIKIAKFIIPNGEGETAHWNGRAQNFLANGMSQLSKRGEVFATTEALLEFMLRANLHGKDDETSLQSLMLGTSSQPLFAPGADRALSSVHGIVSDSLTAMEHLLLRERGQAGERFSMGDWVKQEKDSWSYLSYTDASFAAIQPLFSILIASAIQNVMELRPDADRRFYFVLDELASLGKVPHLVDALTKFRKYGGSVIAGIQSISQLEELYGEKGAQTLLSCFNTKILLRTTDSATAEAESLLVGAELRAEQNTSSTVQADGQESHGTSNSLNERRIIMPRTFMNLPDLKGYALVGGQPGVQEIEIPYAGLDPVFVAEDTDPAIFNI